MNTIQSLTIHAESKTVTSSESLRPDRSIGAFSSSASHPSSQTKSKLPPVTSPRKEEEPSTVSLASILARSSQKTEKKRNDPKKDVKKVKKQKKTQEDQDPFTFISKSFFNYS